MYGLQGVKSTRPVLSLANKEKAALNQWTLFVSAVGCPDVKPIENSYVKRVDNTAFIKCNYSATTYYLTCVDNNWMGQIGNCSLGNLLLLNTLGCSSGKRSQSYCLLKLFNQSYFLLNFGYVTFKSQVHQFQFICNFGPNTTFYIIFGPNFKG